MTYQSKINLICLCLACSLNTIILSAQDNSSFETKYEKGIQHAGDIIQIGLPLAGITTTVIMKDWQGSKEFTYAFLTNLVVTHSLKYVVAKKRPESSSQYNAFPSGHTSASFQGAAFIHRKYGWKFGVPAYVLAAFVGYSRIEGYDDRHDLYDVVGGALVGTGSSFLFTKRFDRKSADLSLSMSKNTFIVGFLMKFQ